MVIIPHQIVWSVGLVDDARNDDPKSPEPSELDGEEIFKGHNELLFITGEGEKQQHRRERPARTTTTGDPPTMQNPPMYSSFVHPETGETVYVDEDSQPIYDVPRPANSFMLFRSDTAKSNPVRPRSKRTLVPMQDLITGRTGGLSAEVHHGEDRIRGDPPPAPETEVDGHAPSIRFRLKRATRHASRLTLASPLLRYSASIGPSNHWSRFRAAIVRDKYGAFQSILSDTVTLKDGIGRLSTPLRLPTHPSCLTNDHKGHAIDCDFDIEEPEAVGEECTIPASSAPGFNRDSQG
ncbi:hypothetical protein C8Q76DRAFT_791059 [Earliella scabrosa]|nr:hypothetical protein C8Q76DRAFT_791059 [Earliella scabrosa]